MVFAGALAALSLLPLGALAHLRMAHPSMYGFNVSYHTFDYDNRPEVPLQYMPFNQWWFHNHINYPPHDGDVFEFPAGGSAIIEIGCNKGFTSYFASDDGRTDLRDGSGKACGGNAPPASVHAASFTDVTGCGIGIVDKANVNDIKPEDFAIFSANHTCPWYNENVFHVPADMPACSEGVCHCAWFWIHSPNSGGMQMFMNAFKCKITNTKPTAKKIGKPQLARRCGYDPVLNRHGDPYNCTIGAKQPLFWLQNEGNNMFEGYYDAPFYNGLYGYTDGGQEDIFVNEQGHYEGATSGSSTTTTTTTAAAQTTTTTAAAQTTTTTAAAQTTTTTAAAQTTSQTTTTTAADKSDSTPASSSGSDNNDNSNSGQTDNESSNNASVNSVSNTSSSASTTTSDSKSNNTSSPNNLASNSKGKQGKHCTKRSTNKKRKRDLIKAGKKAHKKRTGGLSHIFS